MTHSSLRPGDSLHSCLAQPAFRDTVKRLDGSVLRIISSVAVSPVGAGGGVTLGWHADPPAHRRGRPEVDVRLRLQGAGLSVEGGDVACDAEAADACVIGWCQVNCYGAGEGVSLLCCVAADVSREVACYLGTVIGELSVGFRREFDDEGVGYQGAATVQDQGAVVALASEYSHHVGLLSLAGDQRVPHGGGPSFHGVFQAEKESHLVPLPCGMRGTRTHTGIGPDGARSTRQPRGAGLA
nr:hypothetical protein [Streptomyces sp. IB201691-2A2]